MIIVRRAWSEIADGALVVAPDGRIWKLLGKFADYSGRPYVSLVDPADPIDGATANPHVNPSHTVETIVTDATLENAVAILSGNFALQRM